MLDSTLCLLCSIQPRNFVLLCSIQPSNFEHLVSAAALAPGNDLNLGQRPLVDLHLPLSDGGCQPPGSHHHLPSDITSHKVQSGARIEPRTSPRHPRRFRWSPVELSRQFDNRPAGPLTIPAGAASRKQITTPRPSAGRRRMRKDTRVTWLAAAALYMDNNMVEW